MIHAIAIDDEPPALKVIENFCDRLNFICLDKTFSKPGEALNHLKKFPTDLLFLDIEMPSMLGTEFYKLVKQDTMAIFTTAHSEYAVEGFNLSAIDYLLKPFTFERFSQAAHKTREYYSARQASALAQYLYIRADYSLVKVAFADIVFVEGLDDYLKIYQSNGDTVVARMTLKTLLDKLPNKLFMRVHRSFIVPLQRIEQIRNKMIRIAGRDVPIGRSYEAEFLKIFDT